MNTIEKLGDDETFRQIVERSITSFEDNELTEVGEYSFYNCDKLVSVIIPNATTLETYAFRGCANLNSLNLLKVTSMGDNAFRGCSLLPEISFPLLTTVPSSAFYNCSELATLDLPKVIRIFDSAFCNTKVTALNFPLVTSVETSAFNNCKNLSTAKFPKATSIGNYAFNNCTNMASIIVGTELEDKTAICTLGSTDSLPSSIGAIYVPYNLQDKYKTATNWSSFADKIQGYEQPVVCQSLTITADNVAWYQTSTMIHWEATCTYSIEGMMQPGTMVFKGDVASDTFEKNLSSDSSRSIEVSYTFLGKTATTTITQGKHAGDPLGGTIFYIDDTADGAYEFYDAEGNVISSVAVGDSPAMYKVLTPGTKDKYYVCDTTLYPNSRWTYYKNGNYVINNLGTGTAIGTGKTNTNIVMTADDGAYITSDANGYPTIWYQLSQARSLSLGGNTDWFIPSKDEMDKVHTSGIIPFSGKYIWSSSEFGSSNAWYWSSNSWSNYRYKNEYQSVFFVRAF